MFARALNQPLEPPRRRIGEVLYAKVLAEALGLNPLENGEEENPRAQKGRKKKVFQEKEKKSRFFYSQKEVVAR